MELVVKVHKITWIRDKVIKIVFDNWKLNVLNDFAINRIYSRVFYKSYRDVSSWTTRKHSITSFICSAAFGTEGVGAKREKHTHKMLESSLGQSHA